MQIIKRKEKAGNLLFTIAIAIELLIMMTDHSAVTLPFRGRFAQLAFVLFGVKILATRYSRQEWFAIVLLGILGTVSYVTCDEEYVIRVMMMVVAARNIDVRMTGKVILWSALTGTAVIVLLSFTGLLGTAVDVRNYGRGVEEARWCLGFSHANNVHDMFWYLSAFYLFLEQKKCNWKHYAILSVLNIGLFYLTASRTGVMAAEVMILGCAFLHYFPQWNRKIWVYLTTFLGLTGTIFLTLMGGMYGIGRSGLVLFFDRFLTGRLEMIWEYAPVSSWTVFPSSTRLLYVDNGFAWLFYSYGIVVGIVYLLLILSMIYHMYCMGNGAGVVFLLSIILVTFMETTFIFNTSLLCNPLYFLLFNEWYRRRGQAREVLA